MFFAVDLPKLRTVIGSNDSSLIDAILSTDHRMTPEGQTALREIVAGKRFARGQGKRFARGQACLSAFLGNRAVKKLIRRNRGGICGEIDATQVNV